MFTDMMNPHTAGKSIIIGISINDLAETIVRLTGSKSRIVHRPERAGDVKHSTACVDKAAAAGYRANHTFDEGLAATIEFYRKRRGR